MQIKNPGVYAITNLINDKMYIGSTVNYFLNKRRHLHRLRNNKCKIKTLQDDWNEFGENNFNIRLIKEVKEEESNILENLEEEFILKYKTNEENLGYNKRLPSNQGESLERRQRISKSKKESYLISPPKNLKQISPEEWIIKRTENPNFKVPNHIPIENPINRKKRVFKICKENYIIIDSFESISKASENVCIKTKHLQKVLSKNKYNVKYLVSCNNFIWVTEENFPENFDFTIYKDKNYFNTLIKKEKSIKIIKEIKIQNIETGEIKIFNKDIEIANFLQVKKIRIVELKKGFKNKGGGHTTKINHVKGWKFA